MRSHAMITVATILAVAADPTTGDVDRLLGSWRLTCIARGGEPLVGEGVPTLGMLLVVEGYRFHWTGGGEVPAGTFRIEPERRPRAIDIVPDAGPNRGQTQVGAGGN